MGGEGLESGLFFLYLRSSKKTSATVRQNNTTPRLIPTISASASVLEWLCTSAAIVGVGLDIEGTELSITDELWLRMVVVDVIALSEGEDVVRAAVGVTELILILMESWADICRSPELVTAGGGSSEDVEVCVGWKVEKVVVAGAVPVATVRVPVEVSPEL